MDSHSPITSRKSSPRLNYYYNYNGDGEMESHVSRARGSSGPGPGCGCDRGQGWVDKQSSATVVKTTTGQDQQPQPIEQQHVEGDKKRSRVAALRSKFSLRDIGKEARKEQLSQEDDNQLNGHDNNSNLGESFDNISQGDFDEKGLYIPKSKKAGVPDVYPQSAPPCQTQTMTSLRNSLMSSHTDYISCKSARLPSGSEEENLEMSRTKQENVNVNANSSANTIIDEEAGNHVDALISGEVSPARSGRYHNSGHGEIIKAQSSFCSLKAERDASTPDLPFHHGYLDSNSNRRPSGNESESTRSRASRNERIFTDTTSTSHGGFAPPPPDPSYQNTITLEQQLFSHAQALHHHMNSVVGRITKTFEGSNSWTMDQILRNVEAMSDTARLLNSRSVSQSDHMMNMQREMSDIREQVNAAHFEVRRAEQRLQMTFRQEMGKLRRDLNMLLVSSNGSMVDSRVLQGTQSVPDMKNQPRKDQTFKGKDVAENNSKPGNSISPSTPIKRSAHRSPAQESFGSPQSRAAKLGSSTTLDAVSDTDRALPDKTTVDDPNRNEEGSKTPHIKNMMLGFRRRREGCDSSYSSSSSRFLRTPRRNKNNGNKTSSVFSQVGDLYSNKPTAAASTPPVPPVPTSLAQPNDGQKSPSAIHPALRNARQQQIMREREQQYQTDYQPARSDNFL